MSGNLISDNDDSFDFEASEFSGHRMAKTLKFVIFVVQMALAAAALLAITAAFWMLFSPTLQQQFMSKVEMADYPNHLFLPMTCLILAVIASAWYYVLHMLGKVVETIIAGDPFIVANIGRLRRIWIVIALTEVFRMVMKVYTGSAFADSNDGWEIRIGVWFLVFVIATLSEAFRYGAKLRQEQELTI